MSHRKEKFYIRIVRLFLLLIMLMVGMQLSISYFGTKKIVSHLTDNLSDKLTNTVLEKISTLIDVPSRQTRVLGKLLREQDAYFQNIAERHQLLWQLMATQSEETPYLASLYVSDRNGNFVQVRQIPELATRIVIREGSSATDIWWYRDSEFNVISKKQAATDFDPRARPWYLNTGTEPKNYLTDIYLFHSLKKPGITITYPITDNSGALLQIVAADITLESVSAFLQRNPVTKNGAIYLVSRGGDIVASSTSAESTHIDASSGDVRLLHVDDLALPVVRQALDQYRLNPESGTMAISNGGDFYVRVVPANRSGLLLISVIPESDILGPVLVLIGRSFLFYIIIALLAMAGVIMVSKSISRPILKLSDEVKHIADFRLDEFKGIKTNIEEVATMNASLISAVDALKSFKKYVPGELVRQIIQSEGAAEIGGKEVDVTMMFTDIENFTTLSEGVAPHQLIEQLSEYFDGLTRIIVANGGTIDKYIGDAIMAFWGAPRPMEDSAVSACRAALQLQEKLVELNRKWQSEGRPSMPTRIGIHSGMAIVGNIGSEDRINYSAIGDNVNIASRLEGLNKEFNTRILISDATFQRVKSRFICQEIGETVVKGRQEAIKIYQPIEEK